GKISGVLVVFVWMHVSCFFFFFFQAEDGIRDLIVTGVQTCALPIFIGDLAHAEEEKGKPLPGVAQVAMQGGAYAAKTIRARLERSEERRVGKECRSRWSPEE